MLKILTVVINPFIKLIKNFGLARTIGYVVMFACVVFTAVSLLNIDRTVQNAINSHNEAEIEAHDRAVEKRYENSPKIDRIGGRRKFM